MSQKDKPRKPSMGSLILSTFAAAFGVQTDKNRERDFQQSSIVPYIVSGIIFTVLFMLTLIFIVSRVVGD